MRPVERGASPRVYTDYKDAFGDLRARLGDYCSYCERRIPSGLAVEHVVPKSLHPELENEWTNFLLSCANCNSTKGNKAVEIDDFLWPYHDNTFLAFAYAKGGFVHLAANLTVAQEAKAQALMALLGLQRHQAPGWEDPSRADRRWRNREEVWAIAEKCKEDFESLQRIVVAKELIITTAKGYGLFSVWMTVFEDDSEMKTALIQAFLGTALSCFEQTGTAVNRPGRII